MKIMLKNNIKIVQDLVSKNEIKTTYNDATNLLKLQHNLIRMKGY
jgi:ribosomal protein L17